MKAYCVEFHLEKATCTIEGIDYLAVGFGTFPLRNIACKTAVDQAIRAGYRIIDTATFYENLEDIALAIQSYDRHHFYLISKVWHDMQEPVNLRKDCEDTLFKLRTEYLDAYLLHWPNSAISIEKTLTAMNDLRKEDPSYWFKQCQCKPFKKNIRDWNSYYMGASRNASSFLRSSASCFVSRTSHRHSSMGSFKSRRSLSR